MSENEAQYTTSMGYSETSTQRNLIAINIYIRKSETSEINNSRVHLKNIEKEAQKKTLEVGRTDKIR